MQPKTFKTIARICLLLFCLAFVARTAFVIGSRIASNSFDSLDMLLAILGLMALYIASVSFKKLRSRA